MKNNEVIKIFMVDDSQLMVEYIEKDIQAHKNFKFMGSAASGEDCLAKIKNMPLDVILMDIGLPGINGIETAEQIIKDKGADAPTIIFLTVYRDFEYAEKALELRSSLLGKRITSQVLFEKIVQIVKEDEIIINPNPVRQGPSNEDRHKEQVRSILRNELTEDELIVASLVRSGKTSQEISNELNKRETKVQDLRKSAFRKLEGHFGNMNAPLLATIMEYSGLCEKLSAVLPID